MQITDLRPDGPTKMHKFVIAIYVLVAMLIIANLYILRDPIYNQLKVWKVVPLPETFTELYFNNHTNLPTQIGANENHNFEFVIVNHEAKTMQYNWIVYAVPDETFVFKETSMSASTPTLKNHEIINIETPQSTEEATELDAETKETPEKKILIASGRESILDGYSKDVTITFKLEQTYARQKIVVELVDMDQKIHYWVTGK